MDRYKRAIRKDREKRARERHAPKTDDDRMYQTQLAIFDAIMKFYGEAEAKGLVGQQRARYADHFASNAAKQIREIWGGASGDSDE